MPLELPATPALKYSLFSVPQALFLCGAAKSVLEEGACSRAIFPTSLPVMAIQSFPFPSTIMYSSVQDYKAQRENTITQKRTSEAELLNYFFSCMNLPWLVCKIFSFPKNGEQRRQEEWLQWKYAVNFLMFQFKNRPERK